MLQKIRINYGKGFSKKNESDSNQADVRLLGESLIGIANAIERACAVAGESKQNLSFHIDNHKIGSDIFDLTICFASNYGPLIIQSIELVNILKEIGFLQGDGVGLLDFFKWKEDNPVHEIIEEKKDTISIIADNGSTINMNQYVYKLACDPEMAKDLKRGIVEPISSGIGSISLDSKEGDIPIEGVSFSKDNLPIISAYSPKLEDPEPNIIKKWLTITRPDLDKGTDFYFKDDHKKGDRRIVIEDANFVREVLQGKKFKHGDCLYVQIEELQSFNVKGHLSTKMSIKNVMDFRSNEILPLPIE